MALGDDVRRADVCCAAVADVFVDVFEAQDTRAGRKPPMLANPIGTVPMIGGRLARATRAPDLVMTDGFAALVEGPHPVGAEGSPDATVTAANPYRRMFDVVWSGRRHVMMGATQIDRFGNQNIWAIGPKPNPKVALLGPRGAPGNTINNPTSYWVPNHSAKVLVPNVDYVSGAGTDRARVLGDGGRFHWLPAVITNLAVLDFETPDGAMRLRSIHPGVTVDEVVAATGFELAGVDGDVAVTRTPTAVEIEAISAIDPDGRRYREVPDPEPATADG